MQSLSTLAPLLISASTITVKPGFSEAKIIARCSGVICNEACPGSQTPIYGNEAPSYTDTIDRSRSQTPLKRGPTLSFPSSPLTSPLVLICDSRSLLQGEAAVDDRFGDDEARRWIDGGGPGVMIMQGGQRQAGRPARRKPRSNDAGRSKTHFFATFRDLEDTNQ